MTFQKGNTLWKLKVCFKGINLGPKNGQWKGDDVGHHSLHQWLRYHISKPKKCEFCKINPSLDLANKTGIYNREFSNWEWLCRRCHMVKDGRLEEFISRCSRPDIKNETIRHLRKLGYSYTKIAHQLNTTRRTIREREKIL